MDYVSELSIKGKLKVITMSSPFVHFKMYKAAFVVSLAAIATYGFMVEAVDPLTRGVGKDFSAFPLLFFFVFLPYGLLLHEPLVLSRPKTCTQDY